MKNSDRTNETKRKSLSIQIESSKTCPKKIGNVTINNAQQRINEEK